MQECQEEQEWNTGYLLRCLLTQYREYFIYHTVTVKSHGSHALYWAWGKEKGMENRINDCDIAMEAVMKLKKEFENIEKSRFVSFLEDVIEENVLKEDQTGESELARGIMRDDRNLIGCIAMVVDWAFVNKEHIDDRIVKATPSKVRTPLYLGWPDRSEVLEIAKGYYTEKEK